jgi:hypothetical protein
MTNRPPLSPLYNSDVSVCSISSYQYERCPMLAVSLCAVGVSLSAGVLPGLGTGLGGRRADAPPPGDRAGSEVTGRQPRKRDVKSADQHFTRTQNPN